MTTVTLTGAQETQTADLTPVEGWNSFVSLALRELGYREAQINGSRAVGIPDNNPLGLTEEDLQSLATHGMHILTIQEPYYRDSGISYYTLPDGSISLGRILSSPNKDRSYPGESIVHIEARLERLFKENPKLEKKLHNSCKDPKDLFVLANNIELIVLV